jgi:hypothetical protein
MLLGRWNWYLPNWLGWLPRHSPLAEAAAVQDTEWVTTAV